MKKHIPLFLSICAFIFSCGGEDTYESPDAGLHLPNCALDEPKVCVVAKGDMLLLTGKPYAVRPYSSIRVYDLYENADSDDAKGDGSFSFITTVINPLKIGMVRITANSSFCMPTTKEFLIMPSQEACDYYHQNQK